MLAAAMAGFSLLNGVQDTFLPDKLNVINTSTFVDGVFQYGVLVLPFIFDPKALLPVLIKFGILFALADIVSKAIARNNAATDSKLQQFFQNLRFRERASALFAAAFIAYLKSTAQ